MERKDRILEILKDLKLENLPFKVNEHNIGELGLDIAKDLNFILKSISINSSLQWCFGRASVCHCFVQ